MAKKNRVVIVMRHAVLPEDEGKCHFIGTYPSTKLAKEWIKKQKGEYHGSGDYFIAVDEDAPNG